jgi:hypothetical protein
MAPAHATGHVRIVDRKGGPVFYAKPKIPLPDGTVYEPQRRLGRVWSKRSRPPTGYLTKAQAEARVAAILAGDDPLGTSSRRTSRSSRREKSGCAT